MTMKSLLTVWVASFLFLHSNAYAQYAQPLVGKPTVKNGVISFSRADGSLQAVDTGLTTALTNTLSTTGGNITGSVGIYNTTPATPLDVVGSATFGANVSQRGTYGYGGVLNDEVTAATTQTLTNTILHVFANTLDQVNLAWMSSPSRWDFMESNNGYIPLSIHLDGTGIVVSGGETLNGTLNAVALNGSATIGAGGSQTLTQLASVANAALTPSSDVGANKVTVGSKQYTSLNSYLSNLSTSTAPIATTTVAGVVKPDGTTLTVGSDGTLKASGTASTVAAGTDISKTMVTSTLAGAVPLTAASRTSRIISLSELGALPNDAVTDTKAMKQALADAKTTPGSVVLMDLAQVALTAPDGNGFQIPSKTTLAGLGKEATEVTWNDSDGTASDAVDVNLFTADLTTGAAGNPSNTANGIVFRDFHVKGSYLSVGTVQSGYGGYPFIPYNVAGLTIDHVGSYQARLMAFSIRQSSEVVVENSEVNIAGRDGINLSSCTAYTIIHNRVLYTDDDGIAPHSATSDATIGTSNTARLDGIIADNYLFQTEGIHVLSARSTNITGNIISHSRYHGIDLNTVYSSGGNGGGEGFASQNADNISNNIITDIYDRNALDGLVGGVDYIQIDGESAKAGSLGAIPGQPAVSGNAAKEAVGTMHTPYPYDIDNTTETSGAGSTTNGTNGIHIHDNILQRTMVATDNSVSGFPNWAALGLGDIYLRTATPQNPNTIGEGYIRENGIHIYGGVIANLSVENNSIIGLGTGFDFGNGGNDYGHVILRGNNFYDLTYAGVLIENNPTTTKGVIEIDDNNFDLDPYHIGNQRAYTGSWSTNGGPIGIRSAQTSTAASLSVVVQRNSFRNMYEDTNLDPGSLVGSKYYTGPTFFADNIDYWQPSVLNYFSTANKGIGFGHLVGFRHIIVGSDPTVPATYDTILFAPPVATYAEPASGGPWVQGTFVENAQPTSSTSPRGWLRLTTGSNNVDGTDWSARQ